MLVTSLLMLNILKIFNNVFHKRLLHNLRKCQLLLKIVNWIDSFLKERTSILKLLKYEFEDFAIYINIFQNSSLSFILYLFYNTDMLDLVNDLQLKIIAASWINDVNIMITEKLAVKNCKTLYTVYSYIEQ